MAYSATPAVPADQPSRPHGHPPSGERIAQLQPIAALARVLQELESAGNQAHPQQYQAVASRLSGLLENVEPDALLYQVLSAFPAAAELYENVRFEHAGLCLHDIEQVAQAEQATRDALAAIRDRSSS